MVYANRGEGGAYNGASASATIASLAAGASAITHSADMLPELP